MWRASKSRGDTVLYVLNVTEYFVFTDHLALLSTPLTDFKKGSSLGVKNTICMMEFEAPEALIKGLGMHRISSA